MISSWQPFMKALASHAEQAEAFSIPPQALKSGLRDP